MTATTFDAAAYLGELLTARLDGKAIAWLDEAIRETGDGVSSTRFGALLSLTSRHVLAKPLAPTVDQRAAAAAGLEGWDPQRWDLREAARVRLVLARPDLEADSCVADLEEAFRYADAGELRALYKSLALLPGGERFIWRAGEGCRTNIVPVFESVACDSPYAVTHLDDIAWKQLVVKALFIGAPLWRVWGLDGRLSEDLARMSMDLADERRSAGRPVPCELWLTLGQHGGDRAAASLAREVAAGDTLGADAPGVRAAELALLRRHENDWAAHGCDQTAFRQFDPRETE